MEQSPYWKANRFAASQEILSILWNLKVHDRIHKCPTPVLTLSLLNPVHTSHPTSWRFILILSSHLRLGLPSGLFPSGFLTKTLYTPLPSPYVLHAQPISLTADKGCFSSLGVERSANNSPWKHSFVTKYSQTKKYIGLNIRGSLCC
jgi:hypothetical protein